MDHTKHYFWVEKKNETLQINVIQKKLDLLKSLASVDEIISLFVFSKSMKSMMTLENYFLLS